MAGSALQNSSKLKLDALVPELPKFDFHCQFGGSGKFEQVTACVCRGSVKFVHGAGGGAPSSPRDSLRRSLTGGSRSVMDDAVWLTVDVLGCAVTKPKSARKGHPHALRLDVCETDSRGHNKYVLSLKDLHDMVAWQECLAA